MKLYERLLKSPWFLVLVGGFLCLVSVTRQTEFWGAKFTLIPGWWLNFIGGLGVLVILAGLAVAILAAAKSSPIRAIPLVGRDAIYHAARAMVERCPHDQIIRATSISTTMPGDDESDHPLVEAYLDAIVNKCAQAKLQSQALVYRTVLGFQRDSNGIPPAHKLRSITRRRDLFKAHGLSRSLDMRYIETDWSLDVLIVGPDHMLIAFPTMPSDRRLRLGLHVENHDFVQHAIKWYDECVVSQSKPLVWESNDTARIAG